MNEIITKIRKLLDSSLQLMIDRKELPENCADIKYDVWYDKKRGCYTTNLVFVISKQKRG